MDNDDITELLLEQFLLLEIKVNSLFDVRQFKNLVYTVVYAVIDKLHHEIIIGDPEIVETSETCSGVHKEIHQDPSCGV